MQMQTKPQPQCQDYVVPGCTELSKRPVGDIHLQDEAVWEVHTDGHRTHGLCLGKGLLVPQLLGLQRPPLLCVLPRPACRPQVTTATLLSSEWVSGRPMGALSEHAAGV